MGGSDDPSNLVLLTIEEHAEAHRLLWVSHNKQEDFMAWKMLSGKTVEAEKARIELAKIGFNKFLQSEDTTQWKANISASLRGKIQSEESKLKKSESLKRSYVNGERDTWFRYADKSFFQNNYNSERLSAGRRNSKVWKDSVTSEEYRKKKTEVDPRSKKISVNGTSYPSIRSAAKSLGIPYSRLRSLLNGKNILTLHNI